jgi:hypothetical protein
MFSLFGGYLYFLYGYLNFWLSLLFMLCVIFCPKMPSCFKVVHVFLLVGLILINFFAVIFTIIIFGLIIIIGGGILLLMTNPSKFENTVSKISDDIEDIEKGTEYVKNYKE